MSQVNKNDKPQKKQRMAPEHLFRFNCHLGVSCFTQCCRDITVVLTPYDVLRLKNRVGISSDEFLERYVITIPKETRLIPMVILKMNEVDKRCPFVTEDGCTVYQDRPWPCRMYPLDMEGDGTFHTVSNASRCLGLNEKDEWKIMDWLGEQGVTPYEEMNEHFSKVIIPLQVQELEIDNPQITKMVFMSLYNLDRFRDFVFKSSFLDRFEVEEPERISRIKEDDTELLKFAFDWIKFGIFGEKLFWIKENKP